MKYEDLKVFVGNLPLGTLDTEVEVFLRNLVDINLQINDIFTLFNKRNLGPEPTISAIVTLGSNFQRDCVMNTFSEKYLSNRYQFKNKMGKISKLYISLCHPKRNFKNDFNLPKYANGKEAMHRNTISEEQHLTENRNYQNIESNDNSADNCNYAQLNKEINDLEYALEKKCPELYVSSKELLLLEKECDDLSRSLDTKKKNLASKHIEYNEVFEVFEQLNC